jgi:hypothetical protein
MEKTEFKAGDKVVLINTIDVVYIFLAYENDTQAKCSDSKGKEVVLPLAALKLYTPPSYGGGRY